MNAPTAMRTNKLVGNSRRPAPPIQAQVDAMVESIRSDGRIIVPIKVRLVGGNYEIVDGEVRWLAAQRLNMDIVPIKLIQLDDDTSAAVAIIFSRERESIAPEEVIFELESLVSEFGENAAETVMVRLTELREIAFDNRELNGRINDLLASCGIESQS